MLNSIRHIIIWLSLLKTLSSTIRFIKYVSSSISHKKNLRLWNFGTQRSLKVISKFNFNLYLRSYGQPVVLVSSTRHFLYDILYSTRIRTLDLQQVS